jgi:hypothetical protein
MARRVHVGTPITLQSVARHRALPPNSPVCAVRDALSAGPLRPAADLASWVRMRRAFWATLPPEESSAGFQTKHVIASPKRVAEADEVFVWAGPELVDQLLLAFAPQLLRWLGSDPKRLRIVPFDDREPGRVHEMAQSAQPDRLPDAELAGLERVVVPRRRGARPLSGRPFDGVQALGLRPTPRFQGQLGVPTSLFVRSS